MSFTSTVSYTYGSGIHSIETPTFTFNPGGIPIELKNNRRWVVWCLIRSNENETKPGKIPVGINKRSVYKLQWTEETRLLHWDEALEVYKQHPTIVSGLGYIFSKDDPYVFIDFDNLVEDDIRLELIMPVETWKERSQSGHGLHAIVRGVIDKSYSNSGIELYNNGRFIAMTGDVIDDCMEIANGQVVLDDLVSICRNNENKGIGRHSSDGKYILPEIVEKGNRNDTMFRYVGSLIGRGFDKEYVSKEALKVNEERFDPPLENDEILSMVERQVSNLVKQAENNSKYLKENYIYIAEENKWYDVEHDSVISSDSLDNLHIIDGFTGVKGENPRLSRWLFRQTDLLKADGIGWVPWRYGEASNSIIYTEKTTGGKRYVNRFKGYSCEPIDGDVSQWYKLLSHLVPEERHRQCVVEWLAFMLQYPNIKCNWQIVLAGIEGAGKDSLLSPFKYIFGSSFKSGGNSDIKSDYDDVLAGTKFLVFNEASRVSGDAMEKLKRISASEASSEFVANIKGKAKVHMKNLWNICICTNNLDALKFTMSERRFYVLFCEKVLSDSDSNLYYRWLLEEGGPSKLFKHLLEIELHLGKAGGFNPNVLPERTVYFEKMFMNTRNDFELAMEDILDMWEYAVINPTNIRDALVRREIKANESMVLQKLEHAGFKRYPTSFKPVKKVGSRTLSHSRKWMYKQGSHMDYLNDPKNVEVYEYIEMVEKSTTNKY